MQAFNEIKAALVLAGVTQREIARELGIDPSVVHKTMKGQCVSARVSGLIVKKLGFDPWNADARSTTQV